MLSVALYFIFITTGVPAQLLPVMFGAPAFLQTSVEDMGPDIPVAASGPAEGQVQDKEHNDLEKLPVVGKHFEVNPVTTSMQCIISLTMQYAIVFTLLALCRTCADSFNLKYDNFPVQKILVTASLTVNYAPMLAVLFLGFRMRVLQLTKGKGTPPEWVQLCMYFCTYAVLALTLTVCVIPIFTGEVIGVDARTGDLAHDAEPFKSPILSVLFTLVKYFIMLGLYVGVVCIIYGVWTYEPPPGTWPEGTKFPVSPAVSCVTILTCLYFLVYAAVAFSRSWTQYTGQNLSRFENVMLTATNTLNFAPMLSILFLAARMRALQMDPADGNPQEWAQQCFYMCTYALLAQTLLSISIPLVMQGEVKEGRTEGDMEYKVENKTIGAALTAGRYLIMLCIYVGFSCVIWSIFTLEHPRGPQYTPPVSVTMQCVITLTCQFFFIYLMVWLCITLKEFTGMEWPLLTQTMENTKATVAHAPMLCILFVGTRMRALQITGNRGAPQGWVQDGMYMATWAVCIQLFMCLVTPLCTGSPAQVDEDGNCTWEPAHPVAFYCVQAMKWLGYFLLWGGIIVVVVGVYTMTPETANGTGAVPVVGDGKVPAGPGASAQIPGYDGIKEPYGANDLPRPSTF